MTSRQLKGWSEEARVAQEMEVVDRKVIINPVLTVLDTGKVSTSLTTAVQKSRMSGETQGELL